MTSFSARRLRLRSARAVPIVIAVAAAAAIFVYELPGLISTDELLVFAAAGLALITAAGTAKARDYGTHAWVAVLLAVISGSGGGVLRDVMLNRVPLLLTADIYAVAAAVVSILILLIERVGSRATAFAVAMTAGFRLRLLSVPFDWNLPHLSG